MKYLICLVLKNQVIQTMLVVVYIDWLIPVVSGKSPKKRPSWTNPVATVGIDFNKFPVSGPLYSPTVLVISLTLTKTHETRKYTNIQVGSLTALAALVALVTLAALAALAAR